MPQFKNAVIIGASSGIGAEMVKQLAQEGTTVAAVARRLGELEKLRDACGADTVKIYAHDVRQFDTAAPLWDQIVADLGSIDLFIYNAGVMPRIEESEYNFAKDREMMEVNVVGAMAWLNPVGAYMEARRAGTIVGISSVAGERGRRGNPAYHTSKAALTTYLESLRNRLFRYGVQVVTVKPGPVDTPMTAGLKLPLIIKADECARGTLALAKGGTGEGYVPAIWAPIMFVIRNVPSVIFRKTNI